MVSAQYRLDAFCHLSRRHGAASEGVIRCELHDLFAIPFERNLVHVVYLCALGTTLLVLRPPPTSRT